jgi:hypothetical protein
MDGEKTKAEYIHCLYPFRASGGSVQFTRVAFDFFMTAIDISGDAKPQLKVITGRFIFFVMIDEHPEVFHIPTRLFAITLDGILYRTGDMAVLFLQGNQLIHHNGLLISHGQNIRRLKHPANLHRKK